MHIGKIRMLPFAIAAVVGVAAGGGTAYAQSVTLKFAHVQPETHAFHKGAEKFAEVLKEVSGGDMAVEIFPNGVMGNERDLLESLQIGAIDVISVTSALTGTFNDKYQIFSLPFLFDDYQHAFAAMDDEKIQSALEPDLISKGIRPIAYWIGGSRSYYGRQPVQSADDMSGKKVRTMEDPIYIQTWKEMGTTPTPLPFGEVYTALQSGMVDGAEGAINSYVSKKFYEVAPNVAFIDYVYSVQPLHISEQTWQKLTDQQREWVREAAQRSAEYERELILEETRAMDETLKELNVNVTRPTIDEFRQEVTEVYDDYRKQADPETYALVERIQELGGN